MAVNLEVRRRIGQAARRTAKEHFDIAILHADAAECDHREAELALPSGPNDLELPGNDSLKPCPIPKKIADVEKFLR